MFIVLFIKINCFNCCLCPVLIPKCCCQQRHSCSADSIKCMPKGRDQIAACPWSASSVLGESPACLAVSDPCSDLLKASPNVSNLFRCYFLSFTAFALGTGSCLTGIGVDNPRRFPYFLFFLVVGNNNNRSS